MTSLPLKSEGLSSLDVRWLQIRPTHDKTTMFDKQQKLSVATTYCMAYIQFPTVFYSGFHYLPEQSGTGSYGSITFKDLFLTLTENNKQ